MIQKHKDPVIEVGEARYEFDLGPGEGGNMAISMLLTSGGDFVTEALAQVLAKHDLKVEASCQNDSFLAFETESHEFDDDVIEEVLQTVLDAMNRTPSRYEIVVAESDWGSHVGFITLW